MRICSFFSPFFLPREKFLLVCGLFESSFMRNGGSQDLIWSKLCIPKMTGYFLIIGQVYIEWKKNILLKTF